MSTPSKQMYFERLLANGGHPRSLDLPAARAWVKRLLKEMAVQDWFAIAYLSVLITAVLIAPASSGRTMNLERLSALSVAFVAILLVTRGGLIRKGVVSALLYRAGLLGVTLISYFMLRGLLPVVNTGGLDAELYALDLQVFGFEPALWFDQFVTVRTTEWFAFFYYSYFFLISAFVLPLLFLGRRMRLFADFAISFMGVYCVAHVIYMLVPGYGPYQFLADEFHNTLPMGFWYERVLEAVNGAGAQKDIFPSLHTAGPTTCFLFAFRHRKLTPYKYVWIPTGFFAANIIIATMFLRWHYIIDIIAGIALASLLSYVAVHLSTWEQGFRKQRGLQPVWRSLWQGNKPAAEVAPERHAAPAAE